MIILNKNIPLNTLILNPIGEGVSTLKLHSDYSLEDVVVPLGFNYSMYSRFSQFEIETTLLYDFKTGLYQFQHLLDDEAITVGMLRVTDVNEAPIYNIIKTDVEVSDDYNVFRG